MATQSVTAHKSPVSALAEFCEFADPVVFANTLKATVFPSGQATNEQLLAFCAVAKEYKLNPFTKQLFAFPSKGGGVVPMVSVDGWASIINNHPQFNGMNFRYEKDSTSGDVYGITCVIHRKDRAHPTVVTEFLEECKGTSQPWAKSPLRMLRHRAMIQCARLAFSFAGIYDESEAAEIAEADVVDSNVGKPNSLGALTRQLKGAKEEAPAAASANTPEQNAALDREIAGQGEAH